MFTAMLTSRRNTIPWQIPEELASPRTVSEILCKEQAVMGMKGADTQLTHWEFFVSIFLCFLGVYNETRDCALSTDAILGSAFMLCFILSLFRGYSKPFLLHRTYLLLFMSAALVCQCFYQPASWHHLNSMLRTAWWTLHPFSDCSILFILILLSRHPHTLYWLFGSQLSDCFLLISTHSLTLHLCISPQTGYFLMC